MSHIRVRWIHGCVMGRRTHAPGVVGIGGVAGGWWLVVVVGDGGCSCVYSNIWVTEPEFIIIIFN